MGNSSLEVEENNYHNNIKCDTNGSKVDIMTSECGSVSNYYHRIHSMHNIQYTNSSAKCHDMNIRVLPPKPPMTKKTNSSRNNKSNDVLNKTTHNCYV